MADTNFSQFTVADTMDDIEFFTGYDSPVEGGERRIHKDNVTFSAEDETARKNANAAQLDIPRGLSNWFAGDFRTKKIAFLGDSTTDAANDWFYQRMFNVNVGYSGSNQGGYHAHTLGALTGMTMADDRDSSTSPARPANFSTTNIINMGINGNTLQGWVNNNSATQAAVGADLFVFCYGINDVRTGGRTLAQVKADLRSAISLMKAGSPGCDIVLRMPNSLLADDPGSTGYVTQGAYPTLAAAAQAYTDILYNAYVDVSAEYVDGVALLNTMDEVTGKTVQVGADNPYMTDILHPNNAGYRAIADALTNLIGKAYPFSQYKADKARTTSYASPFDYYKRACEDTNYWNLIYEARTNSLPAAQSYIDWGDSNYLSKIKKGLHVMVIDGQEAFVIPSSASLIDLAGKIRMTNFGYTIQNSYRANIKLQIFEHKFDRAPLSENKHRSIAVNPYYWRFRTCVATSGAITLYSVTNEKNQDLRVDEITENDSLIFSDNTVIPLTGATFSVLSGLRITLAGDHSAVTGLSGAVWGTHAYTSDYDSVSLVASTKRAYSSGQQVKNSVSTLASGEFPINLALGNAFTGDISANATLKNPTGLISSSSSSWTFRGTVTGAGGWTFSLDTQYVFDGEIPTLDTGVKFTLYCQSFSDSVTHVSIKVG